MEGLDYEVKNDKKDCKGVCYYAIKPCMFEDERRR
jgi:hypothetical protein